jgi:hypothetical protein
MRSTRTTTLQPPVRVHPARNIKEVILFCTDEPFLAPLSRLNAIFVLAVHRIAKSLNLFNWSMSSAIDLYFHLISRRRRRG